MSSLILWVYPILKHVVFPLSWLEMVFIFGNQNLYCHKVFEIITFGLKLLLKGKAGAKRGISSTEIYSRNLNSREAFVGISSRC